MWYRVQHNYLLCISPCLMYLTHSFNIHYQIQKGYWGNIFWGHRFNKFRKPFHKFIYVDNISRPKGKQDKCFLSDVMTEKKSDNRINYIDGNPATFIENRYWTYTCWLSRHTDVHMCCPCQGLYQKQRVN